MYYSEFTIRLIGEVRKHEILYNTKYEKRPKPEKEEAWATVGSVLSETPDKCKKHWKNVRDRYVKVKHMRDKHFQRGGTELDAPAKYIYFEQLDFMREFSLKKDILIDNTELVSTASVSPDQLLYEESKDSDSNVVFIDYTTQFIDIVKEYPELYDDHSELKRYRSKDTWKRIAKAMDDRFTVGQLRHYWIQLMKKHKVYLEGFFKYHGIVENEEIFEQLSFANVGLQMKREQFSEFSGVVTTKDQCFEDEEEHLVTEDQEDEELSDYEEAVDASSDWIAERELAERETNKRKRESESELEPEVKKQATVIFESTFVEPGKQKTSTKPSEVEDRFDLYGKKVAMDLSSLFRELSRKDPNLAIKGEIEVLQLILKLREGLNS